MTKYTDQLWSDLVREHGQAFEHVEAKERGRARLLRRPRLLAGSTLGLAGAIAAVVLGLTAATGTPAFAVTTNSNGSVLVTINETTALPQANAKLTTMGIHEQVTIYMVPGAATESGPVTCTTTGNVTGPTLQVLVGDDGSQSVPAGQVAGNSGVGTYHLDHCATSSDTGSGLAGNSGAS